MHGFTVFLIAFFTSVFAATGTVYFIERFDLFAGLGQRTEQRVVPDVLGLPETAARESLRQHGLTFVGAREPSLDAKPGTAVRQSIPAGQKIPADHPVTVTVAMEPARAPALSGLTLEEATKRLEPLGTKLEVGEPVPHETIPEGRVVSQLPAADAALEKGRALRVQLSSGAASIEVPKLVGLSVNQAKAAIEQAGLKVGPIRWASIAETSTYVVLSQTPAAGEKIKPGTEVSLSANR